MATATPEQAKRSPEIPLKIEYDFTGYAMFDDINMSAEEYEVWNALNLRPEKVQYYRLVCYRELFEKKQCAVMKFIEPNDAQKAMHMHRGRRISDELIHGMNVKVCIEAFAELENFLAEHVLDFEKIVETPVAVYNFYDQGDAEENIRAFMAQFGPIKEIIPLGIKYYGLGNAMVIFRYYTSALAAQIAFHEEFMYGRHVLVNTRRKRDDILSTLFDLEKVHKGTQASPTLEKIWFKSF